MSLKKARNDLASDNETNGNVAISSELSNLRDPFVIIVPPHCTVRIDMK